MATRALTLPHSIVVDSESTVRRDGLYVAADEAFQALCSRDLQRMVDALNSPAHPLDRHHLLMKIVEELYKVRSEPESRANLYRYASLHLQELPVLIPALTRNSAGLLPLISTFEKFARSLLEEERFDEASSVWDRAFEVGYASASERCAEQKRITKKRAKAAPQASKRPLGHPLGHQGRYEH